MDKRQRLVEVPTCVDIYALRSEFGVRRRSAQSLADQNPSFPLPRVPGTNDFQFAEVILTDSNGNSPRRSGRCNRCHEAVADLASIAMA
jgi:hypothetical protein